MNCIKKNFVIEIKYIVFYKFSQKKQNISRFDYVKCKNRWIKISTKTK